jgi:hypothetical protein
VSKNSLGFFFSMLKCLSKAPLVLSHKSDFYLSLIKNINRAIPHTQAKPFGFSAVAGRADETTRFILPLSQAFKEHSTALKNWVNDYFPVFLTYLGSEIKDEDFSLKKNPEDIRINLRFRVLQDRAGYSLSPHKDSADTLFAFLLQLSDKNPVTSAFLRDKQLFSFEYEDVKNELNLISALSSYISKIYQDEASIILSKNQFGVSDYVAWDNRKRAWLVKAAAKHVTLIKYDEIDLNVGYGELLGIHNPLKDLVFTSSTSAYWQKNCCHGFSPKTFDTRNVLLIDALWKVTKSDYATHSPKQDDAENEFTICMSQQTTKRFLKTAGFLT